MRTRRLPVGAEVQDRGVDFRVWAPKRRAVDVVIDGNCGENAPSLPTLDSGVVSYASAPADTSWIAFFIAVLPPSLDPFCWKPLVLMGSEIPFPFRARPSSIMIPGMPAAVIASATTPRQRVLVSTLEKLSGEARKQELEPPAIVVIGDIVTMRERLVAGNTPANKVIK